MSDDTFRWLIALAIAVVATLAVHIALFTLVRRLGARHRALQRVLDVSRGPVRALVAVVAGWAVLGTDGHDPAPGWVRHGWQIVTIVSLAWLAERMVAGFSDLILHHKARTATTARTRALRTQLIIVRRIAMATVAVIGVIAVLWTFDSMRTLGASLLASAGLVGVVAGVAAQSTLANLVAGLQIAFSEPVRLEDAVVVEGEWGQVEEITLTYVVVRLWDLRRLVLPTRYFLDHPFQNWTRESTNIVGTVFLHVDPSCRFDELRAACEGVVHASTWFNGTEWKMQVADTTELCAVVRITATADDASSAWELRCDIREGLLEWLQREQPEALSSLRSRDRELAGR